MTVNRAEKLMVVLAVLVGVAGCNQSSPTAANGGSKYALAAEPSGAEAVVAAREKVRDGEQVTIVGRVGGEVNPWVDGMAAFTIVDQKLQPCIDGCETPWDYCCDTDVLPQATATVKLVDAQGQPVAIDARQLLGIKELSTVVVKGRAQRDDSGNLTVLAEGVYVKP